VNAYRRTILTQWLLVAALAAIWQTAGRDAGQLGLLLPEGFRLWLTLALSAGAVALFTRQHAAVSASAELRKKVRDQLERQPGARLIIPRTAHEARVFTWLALTAGVCEELLYRGFLWWYVAGVVGNAWLAAFLVVAGFGVAHAYQGVGGIVRTGLAGAVALAAYLGTGSLIAPVVIHATIDVANGRTARTALTRDS
jgi:membrane protease YdiL (CAAX protease family)